MQHPEYNSTLILRSETIYDSIDKPAAHQLSSCAPNVKDHVPTRTIHRRLLARRPGRDSGLEQYCALLTNDHITPTVLVLTPILGPEESLPYYHPAVAHLALRYIQQEPAQLQVEVVPLPGTQIDANSRLYRTCLALLDTVHRYGWGALVQYKKRVIHDRIVPRNDYQDLYLVMRERHKHLVDTWQESTDPLKHVFEVGYRILFNQRFSQIRLQDIGIATFLMLLWKNMYASVAETVDGEDTEPDQEPWKTWPRPPNGFVDLG